MAKLKVVWNSPATEMFNATICWYRRELGRIAARKFRDGIVSKIKTLAEQPGIGRCVSITGFCTDMNLRAIVEHRNHIIVYYIDDGVLYVADILSTRMLNDLKFL